MTQLALPPALTRVMVEDSPCFYRLFGMVPIEQCTPSITVEGHTFFRYRSTPRWVWYKAAISSTGQTFDKAQR